MGVITVSIWVLASVGSKYEKRKKMEVDATYMEQIPKEVNEKTTTKEVTLAIRDL